MKERLKKATKQWIGIILAIVTYYIVHEGMHLLLALMFGVFEKIRFVGLFGIQIVTAENSIHGIDLALFSGLSSLVTISVGYILVFNKSIYEIRSKNILIGIYYIILCFLLLDPLYMSVLSSFVGGGDLNGIVIGLGVSDIPFRILFGVILIINIAIFKKLVVPKYNKIFKEN